MVADDPHDELEGLGFETRAIHAGQPPDPQTGAVTVPIGLATTFAQPEVGSEQPYEYARSGNPTRAALEACVASLEGRQPRLRLLERTGRRGRGAAQPARAR